MNFVEELLIPILGIQIIFIVVLIFKYIEGSKEGNKELEDIPHWKDLKLALREREEIWKEHENMPERKAFQSSLSQDEKEYLELIKNFDETLDEVSQFRKNIEL